MPVLKSNANKNNNNMQISRHKQKGVSFLEVLVAVVIISIGFLATSRMQIMGMRYNQSAFFKSQASIMASDIADRMRANLDGVNDGEYDNISTQSATSDPGCMTNGCDSTNLAALDVFQWSTNIGNTLPDGVGTIERNGDMFEIEVSWNEKVSEAVEAQSVTVWLNP